jgi:hypothetical protein
MSATAIYSRRSSAAPSNAEIERSASAEKKDGFNCSINRIVLIPAKARAIAAFLSYENSNRKGRLLGDAWS